jgi:hypothetical protein
VKHIALPVSGIAFLRIESFGPSNYVIVRDLRKQLYGLPYDPRLEKLFGGVYDISRAGKEFTVGPSMRDGGRAPLTLMEHFVKCSDNEEAAQEAFAQHEAFVAERRELPATEGDELETTAVGLLAAFAEAKNP